MEFLTKYGMANAASELSKILQLERDEKFTLASSGGDGGAAVAGKRKREDAAAIATAGGENGGGGGDGETKKKLPPIDYIVDEDADLEEDDVMAIADTNDNKNNNDAAEPTDKDNTNNIEGGEIAEAVDASPAADDDADDAAVVNNDTNYYNNDSLSTCCGGGYGYDLDASPAITLWGVGYAPPLVNRKVTRFLLEGREEDRNREKDKKTEGKDADADKMKDDDDDEEEEESEEEILASAEVRDEARRYIEGFTCLVTWILSLPDDPANPIGRGRPSSSSDSNNDDGKGGGSHHPHRPHESLATLVKHSLAAAANKKVDQVTLPRGASAVIPSVESLGHHVLLPSSSKPELLNVSFPLLVHTYCELLTSGLEHTALALLDTYRHLYAQIHPSEIADMEKCNSTQMIIALNDDVTHQSLISSEIKSLNNHTATFTQTKIEIEKALGAMRQQQQMNPAQFASGTDEERRLREHEHNHGKLSQNLSRIKKKVQELTETNDALTAKLATNVFIRKVRAMKWNLSISTETFNLLSGFLSSRDDLLPMSALLQARCHLIVERRDPMPFCPPALLEDMDGREKNEGKDAKKVRWAAPVHPIARAIEAGEDIDAIGVDGSEPQHKLARSILTHSEALPFPKYRLDEGEGTDAEARSAVEFNRALLVNGFRRLEALELKREYEAGILSSKSKQINIADPLSPSILLGSLCSSSEADAGAGAPWAEPNIGITSASICPPDGRKVAVGCDDAAVRIFSLDRSSSKKNENAGAASLGEPSMVLLGHKNGFPVFDVDWMRNGRTLLSAGGDGTVRLWDTQAVGPYGRLSNVSQQKGSGGVTSTSLSTVEVPGSKAESLVEVGGAALAVYRGHAPATPVWSVSSAPCGYYFATAGSDYTARIFATDRCTPVRILSGHVSPNVNCVTWHPNCNYVVTASDDKTCRMWDIQTGRCVRLLSGSARGLNLVRVSPSGRYVAGAGHDNVVRIWDLGNGRLVNELRPEQIPGQVEGTIQSMAFSSCGAALAVSGDNCVRIWDVRGAGNHLSNPDYFAATRGPSATSSISNGIQAVTNPLSELEQARPGTRAPTKVFQTNNVSVLDLKYTKRNLLLAVGDY
jgi:WD40 repeat protein